MDIDTKNNNHINRLNIISNLSLFRLVLISLAIGINVVVFLYIKNIDNKDCDCAQLSQGKKQFVKSYSVVSIFLIIMLYLMPVILALVGATGVNSSLIRFINSTGMSVVLSIFLAVGFFNIYLLFRYTSDIKTALCDCETEIEKVTRIFLHYYAIIIIIIYIITTLLTKLIL